MIKCFGFGKLLKQLFIISLISCFGLLGSFFVNGAGATQPVGLDKYASALNTGYKLGFLKGGGLITDFLGQGKSILAFDNDKFFRWATNGQPYIYTPKYQGFFEQYCYCDLLSSGSSSLTNCSCQPMVGDFKSLFKGFFSKVVAGDYAKYNVDVIDNNYASCNQKRYGAYVCFSSNEVGATLCFSYAGPCYNGCQGGAGFCNGMFGGGLVGSQNLSGLTFGLIHSSWIGKAPGQNGYDDYYGGTAGQGSLEIGQGVYTLTGDYVYSTCNNGDVINYLESHGFNKYLCYGGLDNYSNYYTGILYEPVPGSGVSLSNMILYESENFSNNSDWFSYFDGLYARCNNNDYYCNKWTDYPAVYKFWFDFYYDFGGAGLGINKLVHYCDLLDRQDDGSVYTGEIFQNYCNNLISQRRSNNNNGGEYVQGGNLEGVGIFTGVEVQNDPVVFLQTFFDKVKSYVPTDVGDILNLGFLPKYIITFLLALIVFRFLMH